MVRKLFILVSILTVYVFPQSLKVKAYTDTSDYYIGDYIRYTISVEHDKNTVIGIPSVKDSVKQLELISTSQPVEKEENGRIVTEYQFIFSQYDSAEVTIPSIPVRYKGIKPGEKVSWNDTTLPAVATAPVYISIHKLKVDTQEEIKDVKQPLTIPLDWKLILLWVLIGLIVIAAMIFVYIRFIKKKKGELREVPKIILPPDVEALNSLKELEAKQLWQKGMVKEYHSEITEIIRLYFEKRFKLPALELTTSEVNMLLKLKSGASSIIELTNDFLNNADLVKFAKYQPANNVNEEMMLQAKEIIEKTRAGKVVEAQNVQ